MLIQPGLSEFSVANMIELIRVDAKRRVDITILDADGEATDIVEETTAAGEPKGELSLSLTNLGNEVIFEETYWPNIIPEARRIKHVTAGSGKYYVTFGDETGETDTPGTYLANWHARVDLDTEDFYQTQVIEIVSPQVLSLLPRFRLQLDKSVKLISPADYCFLGYNSSMLVLYLRAGLEYINSFQPYIQFLNLDYYLMQTNYAAEILIQSAMYAALQSQLNFSIDTDIPAFSDSGKSFVLQHVQPLTQYIQHLRSELEVRIPNFKLHYVNSGTCSVEVRPDYAFASLLSAAPWGAMFRGLYVSR